MASPAVQNALASVPAIQGITQSYVEFTTKLVTDVMNALVASSISQMRAYADLVAQLERGLAAFKTQATTPQALVAWVSDRVPELADTPTTLKATSAVLSPTTADVIRNLYGQRLVTVLGAPAAGGAYVVPGLSADDMAATTSSGTSLLNNTLKSATPAQIGSPTGAADYTAGGTPTPDPTTHNVAIDLLSAVRTALSDDAASSYQQLDTLVRMGLLRIVVTDGHILTKMTFEMRTSDASERTAQDVYGSSLGVSASAGASWGWGHASAQASYSRFNVHVANEHTQTSTAIYTTMMGEVLVNYRSDYFPALPTQARP